MAYLFLYIAFLIRLIPGSDQADAKILNVLSFCLFACKCLQMFVLSPILGKKLIILQRMLPDLVHYSLILMLFSLVYGVASLALVKHISGGNTNFQYVWIIIFRPVLQMFGDLYIEDLNMKVCNNIVFDKCLPDGFEAEIVVALILMVCYLLIVRVLMFTWLIAVFVNKYRQLEKEAHKLLLIQQYYLGEFFAQQISNRRYQGFCACGLCTNIALKSATAFLKLNWTIFTHSRKIKSGSIFTFFFPTI